MKKRILSILLTLCMVCSLLPGVTQVNAATPPSISLGNGLYLFYEINGNEVTIKGCSTGVSGTLNIPSHVDGKSVTVIDNNLMAS